MLIEIHEFIEGARKARGVTVIIDVFRAFSVACYASDAGAARIIATGNTDSAFKMKDLYRNSFLAGERDEKKIPGFDIGNSPTEILQNNIAGKTLIHTTTAGTAGLVNAVNAEILITGSIVNASAVAAYIRKLDPHHVSLVAMGYRGTVSAEEDLLCARMIRDGIRGEMSSREQELRNLKFSSGRRFFRPENLDFSPPTDFFLCTMADRFGFILRAEPSGEGNIELFRTDIPGL